VYNDPPQITTPQPVELNTQNLPPPPAEQGLLSRGDRMAAPAPTPAPAPAAAPAKPVAEMTLDEKLNYYEQRITELEKMYESQQQLDKRFTALNNRTTDPNPNYIWSATSDGSMRFNPEQLNPTPAAPRTIDSASQARVARMGR
jgi:hypothetical protein